MAIITKQFPSSSSSAVYTTQLDTESGGAACDCPGWRFKKVAAERSCKHTKAMAKEHGVAGTPMESSPEAVLVEKSATAVPSVRPMLASAMREDQSLADFANGEWVMEEKYDGHRMLVVVAAGTVKAWSRPGATHDANERELPEGLREPCLELPDGIYDGELYVPGGTSSDVGRLTMLKDQRIAFFDAIEIRGESLVNVPWETRRQLLEVAVSHVKESTMVGVSEIHEVNLYMVQAIWDRGGEGTILKRKASTYRSGWRTPDWVKVKRQESAICTITGFEKGLSGPCAVVLLVTDAGVKTSTSAPDNASMRDFELRPEFYVGKRLVVSHNGMTAKGKYRHGNWDHLLEA